MRYVDFPGVNRRVSVICMGTDVMGSSRSTELSHKLLDMYAEIGGNFIDTARIYGQQPDGTSLSERCVGAWLRSRGMRDKIVLGTKGAHYNPRTKERRLSRTDIISDCEHSLEDLGVDFIDIYWLHRDDDTRPVEEIVDTLNELKSRGYVGALGASNWTAKRLAEANAYAARTGKAGFSADQPQWSLARQVVPGDTTLVQMHDELRDFHRRTGMPVVPYSSQAKGFYSKLHTQGRAALELGSMKPYDAAENLNKLSVVERIAAEHGVSVGAVALGYLTGQEFPVFPIVGVSREEYMHDVREAGDLVLTADEVRTLDEA